VPAHLHRRRPRDEATQEAEQRSPSASCSRSARRRRRSESIGTKRLIIATCEKGEVEDIESMKKIKGGLDALKKSYPNLAARAAKDIWDAQNPPLVADSLDDVGLGMIEHLDLPPALAEHQEKLDGLLKLVNRSPKVAGFLGKAAERLEQVSGFQPANAVAEARASGWRASSAASS
jgi:hypothetical protein